MMNLLLLLAEEQTKQPEAPPALVQFLPLIAIGLVLYLLMIRPALRREKQHQVLLGALKKNDEVLTSAGIFGTVANIKDNEVTLKVDDNVRLRVLKSSIVQILSAKEAGKDDGEAVKAGSPPPS